MPASGTDGKRRPGLTLRDRLPPLPAFPPRWDTSCRALPASDRLTSLPFPGLPLDVPELVSPHEQPSPRPLCTRLLPQTAPSHRPAPGCLSWGSAAASLNPVSLSLSLTTCFRVSLLPQPRAVPPAPVSLRAPLLSPLPVGAQVPWPLSPPATSRCCWKRVRAAFPFPWGFSAVCLHLPNASRSQVSLSSLFSSWPFASGFSRCLLNVH